MQCKKHGLARLRPAMFSATLAATFVLPSGLVSAGELLSVEKTDRGAVIKCGDQLFAEYLTRSGNKPIVWPLIGPTGKAMTRAYPMVEKNSKEVRDHVHQRSMWFTHGDVDGVDFWSEQPGAGSIAHREYVALEGGSQAVVATKNDWLRADGKKVLEDTRTLKFVSEDGVRTIDFEIELKASEGPVKFGDTKEGSFGVRVAHSIAVDSKQGGQIVNSDGLTDVAAWGKRADWVDYHGPVDGEQVGIAILDHPSNFIHPTRWHVRPYGLFTANPFGGARAFGVPEEGGRTLPAGETLVLRYRVLLHAGDEKAGHVSEAYTAYSAAKRL